MAEVRIQLSDDFHAEIDGKETWVTKTNEPNGVNKIMSIPNEDILRIAEVIKKQSKINDRQEIFKQQIFYWQSNNLFTETMLLEFYNYWREPNKSGSKMRFELEKTWNLELRLNRWKNNSYAKSTTNNQQQHTNNSASKLATVSNLR